jgi:hypothetical protein
MCELRVCACVSTSFDKCSLLSTGVHTCVQVATACMHACARTRVRASVQMSARGRACRCVYARSAMCPNICRHACMRVCIYAHIHDVRE